MHGDKILPMGAAWKGQGSNFQQMTLNDLLEKNIKKFQSVTGCTDLVLSRTSTSNRATALAEMEFFWKATILPLQKMYTDGIKNSML